MTTAVAVTTIITGALVKLAGIGAVLKLLLALVPRLSMSQPRKAPQSDPKGEPQAAPAEPETAAPGLPKVVGM